MKVYINIILILLLGCSGTKHSFLDEVQIRFDKGKELYESEKFTRAKEELQFVVMNNPGTQMALDAQYLLGESHFQLKEFDEAAFEFDRFSRFSQNYNKIEKARYRICECAINMSNPFEKDQVNTFTAIDRLQEFIEDYPTSMKLDEATNQISMLRLKLAKKEYESARLYMKLEEYGSALIYLNNVLNLYYDTEIVDDVRLSIIFKVI